MIRLCLLANCALSCRPKLAVKSSTRYHLWGSHISKGANLPNTKSWIISYLSLRTFRRWRLGGFATDMSVSNLKTAWKKIQTTIVKKRHKSRKFSLRRIKMFRRTEIFSIFSEIRSKLKLAFENEKYDRAAFVSSVLPLNDLLCFESLNSSNDDDVGLYWFSAYK